MLPQHKQPNQYSTFSNAISHIKAATLARIDAMHIIEWRAGVFCVSIENWVVSGRVDAIGFRAEF